MFRLAVLLLLGAALVSAGKGNKTKTARKTRSVSLTQLNAEDTATVLRIAKAGRDYPVLESPPKTNFTCAAAWIVPGTLYADRETACQVFHKCDEAGVLSTYICPIKTIFNDQSQTCEWFHQVDCSVNWKPTKPVIAAVAVVETKPTCTTICKNNTEILIQTAEALPINYIASEILARPRPVVTALAPVSVVSSLPILPATDKHVASSASANLIQTSNTPIKVNAIPSPIVAHPPVLGTGILSNFQASSGWGQTTVAPKVVASGWGGTVANKAAVVVPQMAIAAAPRALTSGWGSQTRQVAAPVVATANSGWGSSGQQQIGSFGGVNPGLASADAFFSPFSAYSNGIVNNFVKPFVGFPFAGAFGFMG
ncbi:hypothetical protein BV898_04524 [Hypsibius exemplaris]|uniref:Chitin-binding type-2 domain-containing protein n=1 Tax=Hypsibius exemplaris TaxID=2072580 RepID=A0A1W0X2M5_HYPEX|nr:hypothetical protein BV898_04524 [Hypsibius exemplaris]